MHSIPVSTLNQNYDGTTTKPIHTFQSFKHQPKNVKREKRQGQTSPTSCSCFV